ncbi:TPA: hypothetical protein SIF59_004028 [Escherichia coli]|nr:hypothetical protein [Escherichia coli]HEI0663041.1 hypothetical protein [Escherichia coli]
MSWKDTLESDAVLLRIINGLRAQTVQPYDEINKKRGLQWEASRLVTLAAGATSYSIIKTGAQTVDLKQRAFAFDGVGITASIYKSPTYTGGTPGVLYNFRTGTLTLPLTQLIVEPTVTNNGTKCGADIFAIGPVSNQSKGQNLTIFPGNRILEPNTTYLLTFTSRDTNASQDVAARIEFYEGGLDYPNDDY